MRNQEEVPTVCEWAPVKKIGRHHFYLRRVSIPKKSEVTHVVARVMEASNEKYSLWTTC